MRKSKENPPSISPWDSEVRLLIWLATCVSVLSFLFYFQRGDVLLYGDAIAHMNIARRVFDSKTPGLLQLGTVWLPLPHLLMIPFLISKVMWQRGVGGSIPSMAAYVLGVVGMFRLIRGIFSKGGEVHAIARIAAWLAAVVYALNPNLIYMQTTAMGEALYLALFVWSIVFFREALDGARGAPIKCGLCLMAACLTRYDGWFLSVAMAGIVCGIGIFTKRLSKAAVVKFVLIAAAGPLLWLVYNGIIYRNPLEFENGPYSAKAIERKTQTAGNLGHPGSGSLETAGLYFLKSAQANMAENIGLQRGWVLMLFLGIAGAGVAVRMGWWREGGTDWLPLLFLLIPLPFYALSVAYGGVPIFIPAWWPFTHYNVRYGLQLLPAMAGAVAILAYFAMRSPGKVRLVGLLALSAFVVSSYVSIWNATPITLEEAQVNMRSRNRLEAQLAAWLQKLPGDSTLLMYLGDHVGAVQQAGIPLKRVINEGNHRVWKQPTDAEGLWERTLANPEKYADYVVAFEGDPVWQSIQDHGLRELVEIHVTGQARAALYRAR